MIEALKIKFHLYGLLIGLGIWIASEASYRLAKKRMVKEKTFNQLLIWILVGGILGARIYHVIDYRNYYQQDPVRILKIWQGGLGIWGAVIGGALIIYIFHLLKGKKEKIELKSLLDVVTIGLPLGQAIGRWGNFFNQELYGKVTNLPWGWQIQSSGEKYHPLFLYESLLNLGLFIFLWKTANKKKTKIGDIAGLYLMGYGIIRFCLEWFRPEAMRWQIQGVPVAVIFSVISFSLGLIFYLKNRKQS